MIDAVLALPNVRIDLQRRSVEPSDGAAADRLTTREAEVLAYLAAHADRVVSRDELSTEVWGQSQATLSRACDTTIRRIRTKIEVDPSNPRWLLTVFGTGYRLVLDPAPQTAPGPLPSEERAAIPLSSGRAIDLDRRRIDGPDGPSDLTGNELALLELLVGRAGRSVDRRELLRKAWGGGAGRPLENAIRRLRKKLERDPSRPEVLVTTVDGYRL
ncbi:MAG: winged helix-turn-helix domain-containing protein, partial [Myxococcota bacterium]